MKLLIQNTFVWLENNLNVGNYGFVEIFNLWFLINLHILDVLNTIWLFFHLFLFVAWILWVMKLKNKCMEFHETSFLFRSLLQIVLIRIWYIMPNKWNCYAIFFMIYVIAISLHLLNRIVPDSIYKLFMKNFPDSILV